MGWPNFNQDNANKATHNAIITTPQLLISATLEISIMSPTSKIALSCNASEAVLFLLLDDTTVGVVGVKKFVPSIWGERREGSCMIDFFNYI